jgi:hypothetical protein
MEMKMKIKLLTLLLGIFSIFLIGCDEDDVLVYEDPVPATPQGVFSITGDETVWIYWNGIYEHDVSQYIIYRSFDATTGYTEIGRVDAIANPNLDLLIYEYPDNSTQNGVTYWYAVASLDHAGQVSELSAEEVFDTPRPEGQATIFPNDADASLSGFNLPTATNVYDTSVAADVWIDRDGFGVPYLNVGNDQIDIQDMGFTYSFDDISWAPDLGWSELGYVEIILGHTYVIWTADDHFAKMRAVSFNTGVGGLNSITFQWAYQTDQSNLELSLPAGMKQRPVHDENFLKEKEDGDSPGIPVGYLK